MAIGVSVAPAASRNRWAVLALIIAIRTAVTIQVQSVVHSARCCSPILALSSAMPGSAR